MYQAETFLRRVSGRLFLFTASVATGWRGWRPPARLAEVSFRTDIEPARGQGRRDSRRVARGQDPEGLYDGTEPPEQTLALA